MRALKSAHGREALARVLAHDERAVSLEKAVRILRIDDQVREVKRTPNHPVALVAFVPGRAAIIRNEERAVGRFDEAINALRIRRRDRDRETAVRFLRKTFAVFRRDFGPGRAAIGRTEEAAGRRRVRSVAAGAERPAFAAEIPHRGEEHIGIRRIHRDRRATGRKIAALQDQIPGVAAIGRLIETAIGRIAPERAGHGRVNGVAVLRADDDFRDALGVRQTDARPGFAAISRTVDAVADRDAVARPRFAGADPDVLRVLRIKRDRADRLHRLLVEDWFESRPAVFGFPDAAAGRADKDRELAVRLADWRRSRRRGRSSWRNRCCARRGRRWWRNCTAPAEPSSAEQWRPA